MLRVLCILALCVLAVLPQRVCTCHGVEIGKDTEPVETPHEHDHDCPALEGGMFGEGLKATADAPDLSLALAELMPVPFSDSLAACPATTLRIERPPPLRGVPLYISLLTLRI